MLKYVVALPSFIMVVNGCLDFEALKKYLYFVGADSLVVSAPTYSAVVLTATRVRFPLRGPLLIPLPSLFPMLSCHLSTVLSIKGIKA